jgi:hypothetical protein
MATGDLRRRKVCNRQFEETTHLRRFCSVECRKKHDNAGVNKLPINCGKNSLSNSPSSPVKWRSNSRNESNDFSGSPTFPESGKRDGISYRE